MVALQLADGVDGELLCERHGDELTVKGIVRPAAGHAPSLTDWPVAQLPDGCRPPYRITSHSVAARRKQPASCLADFTPDGQVTVFVPCADADSVYLAARIWLTA